MFESTKQLTQHIETPTGTEPINRKKSVAVQKISIRTVSKNTLSPLNKVVYNIDYYV